MRSDTGSITRGAKPLWGDGSAPVRPELVGDNVADIAVVGGGFTGLWAAYYLLKADPTLKVVIVERERVGFGASGRNGGWVSSIFPVSSARVTALYGKSAALALQAAMNDTVTEIGAVADNEGIACDYARQGFLSLARNNAQLARARATVAAAEAFGLPDQWHLLSAREAADLVGATDIAGGLFTPHCALVDPGKLVHGLAAVVEKLGGVIYEGSEAVSMNAGVVRSRRGSVSAEVVIRATEAFTPQFPEFRRAVAPLYSLVVATAPIAEQTRRALGLVSRIAFSDMRHLRVYGHSTPDGRVVFGGRGAPYHFHSRVEPGFDTDARIHDKIVSTLHDLFPALRHVPITHRWGGPLGVPRDWFPSVGYRPESRTAWGGPYVGDGVATSNLAGRLLRNLILGRSDPLNNLPVVNHRSKNWEVEPFRWLGINTGLHAAAAADAEERVTDKPSRIAAILERLTGAH